MKRTNKIWLWTLRAAVGLLFLAVLSPLLLYVPFVQKIVKNIAVDKLREATGYDISLDRITLRFPLYVSLDGVLVVPTPGDTMIAAANLTVDVKPLPLLRKELAIESATLDDGIYRMTTEDESLYLSVAVDKCRFGYTQLNLSSNTIIASNATLEGGSVVLDSFPEKSVESDTITAAAPWLIKADVIKLHDVSYSMKMQPYIDSLQAHIDDAQLKDGMVDTGSCRVDAHSLVVTGLDCSYFYPETVASGTPAEIDAGKSETAPDAVDGSNLWTITVGDVNLADSHAIYAQTKHTPLSGLDMQYIDADSINIAVTDFYNRGAALRVPVRNISARERCGFAVDTLKCLFEMDSTRLAVTDMLIANAKSRMEGNVESNAAFDRFAAEIDAALDVDDVRMLYPTAGRMLPTSALPSLRLSLSAAGTMRKVDIEECRLALAGMARVTATGSVTNLDDTRRLGCDISFTGRTGNLNGMKKLLIGDADMRRNVLLPPLSLHGRTRVSGNKFSGNASLTLASGDVVLDAGWNGADNAYSMEFDATTLPVDAILPASKLHSITATGVVEGKGFDFFNKATSLQANITVDTLFYNSNHYYGIALNGLLADGKFDVDLSSNNRNCNFQSKARGEIQPQHIIFSFESDFSDLNLTALQFMDVASYGSCSLKTYGDVDLASGAYDIAANISGLRWTLDDNYYYTDAVDAYFSADTLHVDATLTNNDFVIDFDSECSIDTLTAKITEVAGVAARQLRDKYINSDSLRGRLPAMTCEIELGKNNLVQQYLRHTGVEYDRGNIMLANDSTFYMRGKLDRLKVNDMRIDSVRFGAVEYNHKINWRVHVGNSKEHIPGFARAELKGYITGSKLQAQLTQHNFENKTGINVGVNAELTDSTVDVNFFPKEITIGYKPWTVNDNNIIAYNYNTKHFDSNLILTQGVSLLSLTTEHHSDGQDADGVENEDVKLRINNVQIADWLSISPYAPPVKGQLGADFSIKYNTENIWGNGMISIENLYYGKQRVGSLRVNSLIDLDPYSGGTVATANLEVDGRQCVVAFGALNDTIPDERMTLTLEISKFPLKIINPFLPDDILSVAGQLNGMMSVKGTFDRPILDGHISCDSTTIAMPVFGSSIRLADDSIPVDSGLIKFNNYNIYGLNNKPITAHGEVDLRSIANPLVNLRLTGNNVQFVDSKQKRNSQIFGKGFLDLDATAKGSFSNIDLNVSLALLAGSNLTYVLTEDVNTIAARQEQNMVKFVQFNDSSYTVDEDRQTVAMGSINMSAYISVQQGTTFSVFLSKNGKDRAEIFGNGDLKLNMNYLGDKTLTGRFNIDNGFVRYSPPLISQVDFKFDSGSYILWTGDLLNPTLNLKAVETRKANYTGSDSNTRIINFLISLSVTNSLANMDVNFDLDTSDDIAIHNEIHSMSPSQRSSQAVNLLLYNSYTGLDSKATGNLAGNPLFSFVTSRINNWAASAMKGISVSFGLDNYDEVRDGVSSRAIKYSYQVSKSLFDNRFKIVVGGDYTQGTTSSTEIAKNLFNDVSLEYMLNKSGNMLVRIFNHKGFVNVLEGEVTQTGVGFVYKRKLSNLRYLFSFRRPSSGVVVTTVPDTIEAAKKKEDAGGSDNDSDESAGIERQGSPAISEESEKTVNSTDK